MTGKPDSAVCGPLREPPVLKPARTRLDNPKVAPLVAQARDFLEGKWRRLNPYWYQRAHILVTCRGGRYRAAVRYLSTQGISTVRAFRE